MIKYTIVECKVSKFEDVEPTVIPFQIPEDLKGDKLYWTLKVLLYDIFNIVYVEIVDIIDVGDDGYRFEVGGCINLINTINEYYQDVEIGSKRDKEV